MRVVLISGGNIQSGSALAFLQRERVDKIIAVDRGLGFCHCHKITPDAVVGDFDSVDDQVVQSYLGRPDVAVRRLCPQKDDSDTQSAFHLAVEMGASQITILGGIGSRLDHVLANLELLSYGLTLGIRSCMVDAQNLIWASEGPRVVLKRKEQWGKYVSMFALGGPVEGLTLEGFLYPLEDHCLTSRDCGLTVSNEIQAEEAVITFRKGCLLLVMSKD
jgi:thiamine pyrophosphokinase